MKISFALSLLLISTLAVAAPKKKSHTSSSPCDEIRAKADEACVSIMCDDDVKDGNFKNVDECTSDGDYAEGAQGACEDTLSDAVKAYNKKHHTNVHCKEE